MPPSPHLALASRTRSARLAARASPYHANVTLYTEPTESKPTPTAPAVTKAEPAVDSVKLPDLEDAMGSTGSKAKSSAKSKSKTKAKPIQQELTTPHAAPARWAETYALIRGMRARMVAPVDTMGCDQAQVHESDPKARRFATLVSLMLSSQTKDEVTDAAVSALRAVLGGSLCVAAMINADESAIAGAIGKVGFWRRKTQYLKQTAVRLRDEFDSDVPQTVDELCSLPGVGPKMAFLALQTAWKLNVGIGVDVHVHRITNRLGWHAPPSKTPEATRLNLQSWLPKELHPEINHMLVGFGQVMCLPMGPRCDECDVRAASLCPSARTGSSAKGTKKRKPLWPAKEVKEEVKEELQEGASPHVEVKLELEVCEQKPEVD